MDVVVFELTVTSVVSINLHHIVINCNKLLKEWINLTQHQKKIVEEWKTNLMSLAILFHFLCAQHVSDINITTIRSLRLCC